MHYGKCVLQLLHQMEGLNAKHPLSFFFNMVMQCRLLFHYRSSLCSVTFLMFIEIWKAAFDQIYWKQYYCQIVSFLHIYVYNITHISTIQRIYFSKSHKRKLIALSWKLRKMLLQMVWKTGLIFFMHFLPLSLMTRHFVGFTSIIELIT